MFSYYVCKTCPTYDWRWNEFLCYLGMIKEESATLSNILMTTHIFHVKSKTQKVNELYNYYSLKDKILRCKQRLTYMEFLTGNRNTNLIIDIQL